MKISNVFYLVAISCVTGLTAMKEPLSLEQYKNVLAVGDCGQIVTATKQLWYSGTDGIHLHWSGRDFQVTGQPMELSNGTFLKDAPYRDALHDWFVKQLLHPAMYGTMDIGLVFARIDELSNNCDGIFGDDKRALTQREIKYAILAKRFEHSRQEYCNQIVRFLGPVASIGWRSTSEDLINYVGAHDGELSFLGGKLPLKMKLYHNRHLIGLIGIAAVVCVGCLAVYKKYYADNKESEDEEGDDESENQENDQMAEDVKDAHEIA